MRLSGCSTRISIPARSTAYGSFTRLKRGESNFGWSQMAGMKYIPPPFYSMRKIFYYEKNYPLYAVGLFSRHPLAYSLWDDALKYTDDQLDLPGL